jgi:NAD(P)-dependent dehydrogenase (short-subunit alcohol dehydrogenase family)
MTTNGNGNFTGKVAFVTGAGGGIGRATALAFARAGAHVALADVSEPNLQETVHLIEERGGRALGIRCDVTRAEEVKGALDRTIEAFGRLDFAFNNAGVEQPLKPAADLTETEWDRIVDINLRGVFLCMKHEIPLMLKQGGGAIVNTSSGAGGQRHRRSGRVLRREIRHRRPDQGGGPRLRPAEPAHQRRVPRDHRDPDDGPLQRGHS